MLFPIEKLDFLISNIQYFIPNYYEISTIIILFFLFLFFFKLGTVFEGTVQNGILINVLCGWSFTLIIVLTLQIFFIKNITYVSIITFILGLILIIIYGKKIKVSDFFNKKILILSCILPVLLVLASHKLRNWDTFTHWMLLSDSIFYTNNLPINVFHDYYVPGLYYLEFLLKRIISNPEIENFYIIFNLYLIITVVFSILKIFNNNLKFFPIVFVWVIISPIFINYFTFSSYNDFALSCVLFAIYFFIYNEKLNIFNNNQNTIIFSLLSVLMVLIKTEGIIHIFLISSLIFINEIYLNKFKNFRNILKYFFIVSFIYFLWKFHLYSNSIDVRSIGNPFQNKIYFNEFLVGLKNNILDKKFFYIFTLLLLFYSFVGKNLIFNKIIKFYIIHLIFFSIFIVIFTFGAFPPEHIKKASSFWRYTSQLNGGLLILISIYLFKHNFIKNILSKLTVLFFIISLIIPLIFIHKFRQDIFVQEFHIQKNITLLKRHINKGDKVSVISNKPHYHSMILYYYLPKKIIYSRSKYSAMTITENKILINDPVLEEADFVIYLDKDYSSEENYLIIIKNKELKKL
tara:strand:- start:129 stop:1850 length:1722 start_codon:yes stop_codon:yes gene_type:complete